MIVVLADTHRETGHGLVDRAATAVETADHVIHAGDFTTEHVYDAFDAVSPDLYAVHGNRDTPSLSEALPATQTVSVAGVTVAVTHRHANGDTGLAMFGRAHDADLVISGHTHRPHLVDAGDVTLLNPGSHTDPRGTPPTHAEVTVTEAGLRIEVLTRDGSVRESGQVSGREG